MDNKYNSYFFSDFYEENGGGDYRNKERWMPFFSDIADKIIEIFNPKTVLDAGCAFGYLVEALRKKGVEAWGFDISEFAIESADESIKPYVAVHSITEPLTDKFPERFDLVITIEVLEHIFPKEGAKAIANLCSYSDIVVFSSTPSDIEDKTHVNVQLGEYWCKEFAHNSFYRDIVQKADFVSPWAMIFRKSDSIENVIYDYEMGIRIDKLAEKKAREEYTANVYFDTGDGFNDREKTALSYSAQKTTEIKIDLPLNVKAVRFDPLEGSFAAVKILNAASNNGAEALNCVNGFSLFGFDIFNNADPQYLINLKPNTSWLKIGIITCGYDNGEMVKMLDTVNQGKISLENSNNDLKGTIADLRGQLDFWCEEAEKRHKNYTAVLEGLENARKDIEGLNKHIESLKTDLSQEINSREEAHRQIDEHINTINNINRANESLNKEINSLREELVAAKEYSDALLSSTSWKITKPIRAIMRIFKGK